MKILSVTNYSAKNSLYTILNEKQQNNEVIPAFNGHWNIEVVKKSDKEVLDLAKYFCKSSWKELEEITTVRTPILRIKRKNASLAAYYKMRYAVDKIDLEIQNIKSRLSKLEQLYHRSLNEAQEIESLRAKLAEYDDFYNRRCEKFYH